MILEDEQDDLWNDHECWDYKAVTQGMVKYDETKEDNEQQYVNISKIIVPTEFDKQQLLKAFRYIHNLHTIDIDFMAINTIAHLYQRPDMIEVSRNEETKMV